MKNRKIILYALIVIIIITVSIIFIAKTNKKNGTDNINRYEWMSLLCEYEGISDYNKSEPYYNDVDSNNDSFKYIQSAVEWSVLDGKGRFDGEDFATGKFMALTSMKAIGEEGLQFYLGEQSELSEKEYLNVAVELGLISKSDYKKKYTLDEAQEFLDKLDEIRYSTLWVDDYENISYKDGVTLLTSDDLISYSPESEQITVSNSMETSNDIIVFENNGYIIARKIVSNIGDNTYSLEIPTLEEVADEIVISDIDTIDFSDILNFYGDEFIQVASENNGAPVSKTISKKLTSPGFKIKAEETDGLLIVTVTDNATGKKYAMRNLSQCEIEGFSAELNVENIFVGTQLKYKGGSVEYVKFATDIDSDIESSIEGETEKTIKLFETPAPLGTGFVGVNIEFGLQLTLNGEMTLTANIPFENTVMYEKGKGVRNIKHNLSVEKPTFDVSAEAGAYLDLSSTLVAFQAVDIIDAALDVGITATGESVYRDNGMVCADLGIGFPIVKVSVCKDEETLLSSIINEKSWDVVDYDHAKIKYNAHAEALPNGTHQIVDECTYVEGEEIESSADNVVYSRMGPELHVGDGPYAFNYPDNWTVVENSLENIDSIGTVERIVLENERGVQIEYRNPGIINGTYKFGGTMIWEYFHVTQVGDTEFTCYNAETGEVTETGHLVVAKYQIYKEEDASDPNGSTINTDVTSPVFYAVISEHDLGDVDFAFGDDETNQVFYYPGNGAKRVTATSPDGTFSAQEEKEIIEILSTFREAYFEYHDIYGYGY